MIRVLIVGPTSAPWSELAADVESELERLRRPGVELEYRCTGAGPVSVRSEQDVIEVAPHVVRMVIEAADNGFDAVIIDCTDDPGVAEARAAVAIPVVGAGEALRSAMESAPAPVRVFSGDELRTLSPSVLLDEASGAATVVLGGTGHAHLVGLFTDDEPNRSVVEPLEAAVTVCLGTLNRADHGD